MTIGFLSAPKAKKPAFHNPKAMLFTLDSGRGITFDEAARSTLVMGGTGSGKDLFHRTAHVLQPD